MGNNDRKGKNDHTTTDI